MINIRDKSTEINIFHTLLDTLEMVIYICPKVAEIKLTYTLINPAVVDERHGQVPQDKRFRTRPNSHPTSGTIVLMSGSHH